MRFRVTYFGATMTKRMRGRVVHGQKADVVCRSFSESVSGIKTDRGTIVVCFAKAMSRVGHYIQERDSSIGNLV